MSFWKSLQHKTALARQLNLQDWLSLQEAWWVQLAFRLALRRVRFDHILSQGQKGSVKPGDLHTARQLQKLTRIAAHYQRPAATCLTSALALHWMLQQRGIPARLRIGASKNNQGLQAHAWVDLDGEALGEDANLTTKYKPLHSGNR